MNAPESGRDPVTRQQAPRSFRPPFPLRGRPPDGSGNGPTLRRRRSTPRPTRGQWVFAVIAIVVVLSLVGSTLGTIIVDYAGRPQATSEGDPSAFGDQQASLIEDQRATVAASPNDASAMALLAQYLQLGGNSTEAVQWYERALQIDPNDIDIRLSFADMLTQAGRQADSELQYQRVLAIDPANIPAIFYLGDLYQFWKPTPRTSEAVAQFQQVLATQPDSVLATTARERLALLGAATPAAGESGTSGTEPPSTPVASLG